MGLGIGTQPNGTGQPGEPSGTVSGSYASYDHEQTTRATVGEGTITIRDKAQQKQDVAAINRDVTEAQQITRDIRQGVNIYASSASVQQISTVIKHGAVSASSLIKSLQQAGPRDDPDATGSVAEKLEALGGGKPVQRNTPKGAVQFIFPNGMVVRFDLQPGQYLPGQAPHINIEWPGTNINHHIDLKP